MLADGEAPNLTREAALPAWAPAYDIYPLSRQQRAQALAQAATR
jgi:hypothetical protein